MSELKKLESLIKSASEEKGFHIFSSENRRAVFRELSRLPCRTASSISKATGIGVKSVIWHLEKLRKEEFVDMVLRGRRYYIIPGLVYLDDLPLFILLGRRDARKLLRVVWSGCVPISKIGIRKSTLYRIIHDFEDMGIIKRGGERKKYLCPAKKLRHLTEKYDQMGKNFKVEFLKRLEKEGFDVELIGTINYEMKIRVSGMENFTMGVFISPLRTALEVP